MRNEIAKKFFRRNQWKDDDEKLNSLLDNEDTPGDERANVVLVGPIPKEELQEESVRQKSLKQKSQKIITVHWMLMLLIKYQMVEETFYLVVVRPLAVNGQCVARKFEEFEERGLVKFHECAYLKHTYDMKKRVINSFSERREWKSGVAVECGSSHCTFDIKVYKGELPE